MSPEVVAPLIGVAVALPMMLLRNRRPRKMNVGLLWVAPVLVVVGIGAALYLQPHAPWGPLAYAGMTAGLAVGAVAGWWRGKTTAISRDPESGAILAQASPAGMILIVGLLLVRNAVRMWTESNPGAAGFDAAAAADGLLLFAVGLVAVSRLEMWLRARRLQAAAA